MSVINILNPSAIHMPKDIRITFLLVQKVFLCIEELTRHEAMKSASSVLPCCHCIESVTNGHFVSHDLFIYYLNGNQNKEI